MKIKVERNIYYVIKNKDAAEYLGKSEIEVLLQIQDKISKARMLNGKKAFNEYWVCNIDEPYADKVIEVILKGESDKQEE